ncbi:hypothetical protein DFR50_112117 [Roseiarcus fermentans]|uniref:Uncharacterized protein n=1 Tax=Roseiarcus fermentans TaxID=1473586 RepID=A0A366FEU7_9HYPH|nr:hypothetical protein [Roseiarcus fermentans]RBP13147.1 hypothetical protein DFR50_112117 [Roseiarcus fermentans]
MSAIVLSPEWIREELLNAGTSWSVGSFGAIAEFSRDPGEPLLAGADGSRPEAVTAKGGIRFDDLAGVQAIAYETTAKDADLWSHAVALCLPAHVCATSGRSVLTEIGPDRDALREADRDATLFDVGAGTLQVDVCVRTADPDLVRRLRACESQSVLEPESPALKAILEASPHRVFVARIGRVEVYQPIPSPDQKSPDGPHTHFLPKLLRARRTHSAASPIPEGWVPCAHMYPANPARDEMGRPTPFDLALHVRFQDILRAFGDPDLIALKDAVAEGVRQGLDPAALHGPKGRFATAARRVALRQIQAKEGASPALRLWREVFDRVADEASEDDEGKPQADHE